MDLFQEFFVAAMAALIFSCIIVKLVSVSVAVERERTFGKDNKNVVEEEAKITKGLVVKSRKSKKRVKFVEQEEVRSIDRFETQKINEDGVELMPSKVEGLVDQQIVSELEKGDEFKDEKILENLGVIEQCGGEREASDRKTENILKQSDEIKKVDEVLDVKEKEKTNDLVVDGENILEPSLVNDKVDSEDDDDDWEGIERSELEVEFAKAIKFVDEGKGLENLGSELMMQLYGLQKIAVEGPCYESQPMALKVSARAKWNEWQKMGSMNPEVAMEQYIQLLSDHAPAWTHHNKDDHSEVGSVPDSLNDICKDERAQEMKHAAEGGDVTGGEKDKE